jgi:hypothetical protein
MQPGVTTSGLGPPRRIPFGMVTSSGASSSARERSRDLEPDRCRHVAARHPGLRLIDAHSVVREDRGRGSSGSGLRGDRLTVRQKLVHALCNAPLSSYVTSRLPNPSLQDFQESGRCTAVLQPAAIPATRAACG